MVYKLQGYQGVPNSVINRAMEIADLLSENDVTQKVDIDVKVLIL